MDNRKQKFYAVATGRKPGIYLTWYGEAGAQIQVQGYPNAKYKSFPSSDQAKDWLKGMTVESEHSTKKQRALKLVFQSRTDSEPKHSEVVIYTDGSARNNPGPGGYGAIILYGKQRKELSGGFRRTTNNRMELLACIKGLQELKKKRRVTMFSDSQYVINGITKGWAKRWREKGWMRNEFEPALNADLWEELLRLCAVHDVNWVWVKGHAGNPENTKADELATTASSGKNLPPDEVYEAIDQIFSPRIGG